MDTGYNYETRSFNKEINRKFELRLAKDSLALYEKSLPNYEVLSSDHKLCLDLISCLKNAVILLQRRQKL